MGNGIATGGFSRFKKAQEELTMADIEKKYAKEPAAAHPHQKHKIRARMVEEYFRQKNHKPSAGALW